MQMPNGQMIVRAASPPAAPLVSSREPRGHAPRSERAPRRELPDLFRFPCCDLLLPSRLTPPPPPLQQPQIVLLREGTDTSQGKGQLISNINACMAVVDSIRTTLVRRRGGRSRRRSARQRLRRPFDFVFPLTTMTSDRAGPARLGQARARRQGRDHHFERRRDHHEGARRDAIAARRRHRRRRAKRNAPIGQHVPTALPPCLPASRKEARARKNRVETVFAKKQRRARFVSSPPL